MKKVSMRKFSMLGLILIGASAVTAAVLPANDAKMTDNGALAVSDGGLGDGLTCEAGVGNQCTITNENNVASDSSSAGQADSDIQRGGLSIETSTQVSVGAGDVRTVNGSTSEDDD